MPTIVLPPTVEADQAEVWPAQGRSRRSAGLCRCGRRRLAPHGMEAPMTGFVAAGAHCAGSSLGDRFTVHSPNLDRRASRRRLMRSFAAGGVAYLVSPAGNWPAPAMPTTQRRQRPKGGTHGIRPRARWLRIAYQRAGQGPPLVLVHGTADDHNRWLPLLPALAEHFTVYALDRRGRGGSDPTIRRRIRSNASSRTWRRSSTPSRSRHIFSATPSVRSALWRRRFSPVTFASSFSTSHPS